MVWPDMVLHQMDLHTAITNEKYMVGKDPSSWVLTNFALAINYMIKPFLVIKAWDKQSKRYKVKHA